MHRSRASWCHARQEVHSRSRRTGTTIFSLSSFQNMQIYICNIRRSARIFFYSNANIYRFHYVTSRENASRNCSINKLFARPGESNFVVTFVVSLRLPTQLGTRPTRDNYKLMRGLKFPQFHSSLHKCFRSEFTLKWNIFSFSGEFCILYVGMRPTWCRVSIRFPSQPRFDFHKTNCRPCLGFNFNVVLF